MKNSRLGIVSYFAVLVLCRAGDVYCQGKQVDSARPNILFIAVDDLNDWTGTLEGHPQVQTPNLDRFAQEAVNFSNNYCAAPACNPSRTAVMTGLHTYTSGMYHNYQDWREVIPDAETMGEYFRKHGYWSGGAGKIFHYDQVAPDCWDAYWPSQEKNMPEQYYPKPGATVNMPVFERMYMDFDWSPIPLADEETSDFKSVKWVSEQLQKEHDKPFFLACGIYRPHVPWYVPQKYFDMYPLETVQLPKLLENDLDDLGARARQLAGIYHKHVVAAGQWQKAVQGYLASISFADAMVGRLLDALENSDHASNTIVVIWSDHGWMLGEKQHWRKFALWEDVARAVLMMKVPKGATGLPEGAQSGVRSERVTSLVDIYPTLAELCGFPVKKELDGHSLIPLLKDSKAVWDYPAITTFQYSEFSIRTEDWRYIRYKDDSEELYDHRVDPDEWTNLAGDSKYQPVIEKMSEYIPANPAPGPVRR
jgi:arylsulfatase A-like enzyme